MCISTACWFTNFGDRPPRPALELTTKYDSELHPKYDNFPKLYPPQGECDVLAVSKVKDIPCDYSGLMGVPLSFIFKHNPEQFELLGTVRGYVNNAEQYVRLLIRRTSGPRV